MAIRKKSLKNLKHQMRELGRNTASAAEFLADTVRAETRHFAYLAVELVTAKLTGFKQAIKRDTSLDPLGGVTKDPLSRF